MWLLCVEIWNKLYPFRHIEKVKEMHLSVCLHHDFDVVKYFIARKSLGIETAMSHGNCDESILVSMTLPPRPDLAGMEALERWASRADPDRRLRRTYVSKVWDGRLAGVALLRL